MKNVLIIGVTGSLGRQVYEYMLNHPTYRIKALIAWNRTKLVQKLANDVGAIFSSRNTKLLANDIILKDKYDIIVNCVNGLPGILFSWLALSQTKTLVLGNKETLVICGKSFLKQAKQWGISVIPLDSELTTLWHIIHKKGIKGFKKVAIAASGGVLQNKNTTINKSLSFFHHPIWNMGKQITIDSSTMINKMYEWVATNIYFQIHKNTIKTFINLQGNVHAAVFKNNTWLGYLSKPTMEEPIKMIFDTSFSDNLVNVSSNFEEINNNIYPLYTFKDQLLNNKCLRIQVLVMSKLYANLLSRNLITYKEMIFNLKQLFYNM